MIYENAGVVRQGDDAQQSFMRHHILPVEFYIEYCIIYINILIIILNSGVDLKL
jgi:hypothetical protein